MCILVGHKQFELNTRLKRLQCWCMQTPPNSSTVCPCILTQDQRDDLMTICGDLISSADYDPTFLNRIITGDKTWCFLYDLQLKRQSATWKMPVSSWQIKKQGDAWTVVLFKWNCSHGIHLRRCNCNQIRYKEILGRLHDSIHSKCLELWCRKNWLPLHIALSLSKRNLQGNRSPFCHTLCTHLLSTMRLLSLSPHESTPMWA